MENWNFIAPVKFSNVEIVCEIENEDTNQTTNFHISHECIADHLDVDRIYRDEFDYNGYADACEQIFQDYKKAAANNKEDDMTGVYVSNPKVDSIVFSIKRIWTDVVEEYIIPYKGQTNAQLNALALELGASSHERRMC